MNWNWRKANALRAAFYFESIPVAYHLGWLKINTFISLLSLVALVEACVASWRSDVPTKDGGSAQTVQEVLRITFGTIEFLAIIYILFKIKGASDRRLTGGKHKSKRRSADKDFWIF